MKPIADIQSSPDQRNMPIRRVGIKDILHPVQVQMRDADVQPAAARFSLYSSLAASQKGTHMSRFVTLLNERQWCLSSTVIGEMAERITELLDSDASYISATFPFFILKKAPVSGLGGWMDYEVELSASVQHGVCTRRVTVRVPVKSLCPCSKKISDYGAHNQRSQVTVSAQVRAGMQLAMEELITAAEEIASCQLYSVLKRPDEKYVTEHAYENPKFVEDMVRDLATELGQINAVESFEIEAENLESIHNHSAYASISSTDLPAAVHSAAPGSDGS
ncbi:MAG: GTP cyclohydrolase FolE2 [Proteobacteria bacterium]|nr:GTP cyclohydrolase FolE2 [Pseudomonadota bacterium]